MTSFEKRKALVNELRSAHFPFGFQDTKSIQSQYIQKYKEYEAKMQQPVANGRKNNFTVTNPHSGTNYISESKERFPEHALGTKDDPSKLKQIHANKNFVFGYDQNPYDTNYKDDFINKQINRPRPVSQTEPHINFGSDTLSDFTTTYNKVHDKKEGEKKQPIDPQMIRRSNMMLGNDKTNYNTQNTMTYVQKPIENYHVNKTSNLSHIEMGKDGNHYASQNKANFLHKQVSAKPVDKQRVIDFKNAHFQLGFPEGHEYQSEFNSQFTEKGVNFEKAKGNRDSNISLNMDGKNYFDTTYKGEFLNKKNTKGEPLKNIGQIDSVCVGFDPSQFTTQAHQQYKNKLDSFQKSQKQKHPSTLELGDEKGSYMTHNQDIYQDKFKERSKSKLTPEELSQLKGVHFQTGFQRNGYDRSSQNYGKGEGSANKLSKQVIASMRNTNLVSGTDNPFAGGTSYKDSFLWKKGQEN